MTSQIIWIFLWSARFEIQCIYLSVTILLYSIWYARRGAEPAAHFWLIVIAWYITFLGSATALLRWFIYVASRGGGPTPFEVLFMDLLVRALFLGLMPTVAFTILAVALWPKDVALTFGRDTKLALASVLAAFLSILLLLFFLGVLGFRYPVRWPLYWEPF